MHESKALVDTHCHIIPGVDDGSPNLETSLSMADLAQRDGIGTVVATPHVVEGGLGGDEIAARLSDLAAAVTDRGINIRLVAGAEVPMSLCLAGDASVLSRLTLAGSRYLLMETAESSHDQLARAVYQVRLCGLYPILAHPERVGFVSRNPEGLAEIIGRGQAFCQITGASLEGRFSKALRKASEALLKRGLVHLVASDAHSARTRTPTLSASRAIVRSLLGEAGERLIMFENPRRVLENAGLAAAPSAPGGLLARWRRR